MSRTTARSSAFDLADAARGLSSARTPSQLTPFIVLSKWESRMVVHAASNVSSPCGTWAERPADPSASAAMASAASLRCPGGNRAIGSWKRGAESFT
jgi:hypothetical protein